MRAAFVVVAMTCACAAEGRFTVLPDASSDAGDSDSSGARGGAGERPDEYASDVTPSGDDVVGFVDVVADLRPEVSADQRPLGPEPGSEAGREAAPEAQPDLGWNDVLGQPDLVPDVFADTRPAADIVEALPTQVDVAPEAPADVAPPCTGCGNPTTVCGACLRDPPATNPNEFVFVQCVGGILYDCNGHRLAIAGACDSHTTDGGFCVSCTRYAGTQLQCPADAPYCAASTGACSTTP